MSDSWRVAEMVAAEMAKKGLETLTQPLVVAGPAFFLMVGPHNLEGLCWCQPTVERVICTNLRDPDPEHFVFVHDDRVH